MSTVELSLECVPASCLPFIDVFWHCAPSQLAGGPRRNEFTWNGERLFAHFDWVSAREGAIAFVRLQLLPAEGRIWLGSLEVHAEFRGRGIGASIVRSIEEAAAAQHISMIRLFSRQKSTGFWLRMGYEREHDPRYMRKTTFGPALVGN